MASLGNGTSCWEDSSTGDSLTSETDLAEGSCRHVACLAMFLDVSDIKREAGEGGRGCSGWVLSL